MVKCGKCGDKHESINAVRNCYLGTNLDTSLQANGQPKSEQQALDFLSGQDDKPKTPGPMKEFQRLADQLPGLKNARYAVEVDGELKFYQVDRPQEGRWKGYTFIKVQASDETYPVRKLDSRVKILEAIAQDPETAMLRYGKEIGRCGHCGRTLTNEESRAAGIGPVCRSKMEW